MYKSAAMDDLVLGADVLSSTHFKKLFSHVEVISAGGENQGYPWLEWPGPRRSRLFFF